MADATLVLVVLAVLGVAYGAARWRYDTAEAWYRRITWWRRAFGSVLFVLVAITFVQSGNPALMAVAVVLIILAGLWLAVEQPHRNLT